MPDDHEWRLLGTYETQKFIEDVKDEAFAGLFNGPAYELWARNLRFLDGYEHYQLCNKAMIPYFTLEYISNGEDHYYLDGSEHPLELLIKRGALRLSEENVMEYIEFHSDMTFYPYRKVKFITDPSKTPYSGASAMGHHFKTLKYHDKFELTYSNEDACFYITMPVLYNGETIEGYVQVLKTGEINILKPVNIPLMDGKRDHNPLDYDHLHEKELLEQNIAILVHSEEGKRLYETVQNHGCSLKFVSGVGHAAFAANSQTGFVVAPENIETASPYQIIAITGVLRDMELQLMEETRGDPYEDLDDFTTRNCAQNLDILLKICTIGDELAETGHPEVLERFKKSGFEKIYSDYKNKKSYETLMKNYTKLMGIKTKD